MNEYHRPSSTLITVKGASVDEMATILGVRPGERRSSILDCLGSNNGPADSQLFAVGECNGFGIAIAPGYQDDSQLLFDVLTKDREVGSFHFDFPANFASVVIYKGFEPMHRWIVNNGRLIEDLSGHFDYDGVSPEWIDTEGSRFRCNE